MLYQAWTEVGLGSPSPLCTSTGQEQLPPGLHEPPSAQTGPAHAHKVLPRVGRLMVRDTFSL